MAIASLGHSMEPAHPFGGAVTAFSARTFESGSAEQQNCDYPPLPLAMNDFEAFVQKLAVEANGRLPHRRKPSGFNVPCRMTSCYCSSRKSQRGAGAMAKQLDDLSDLVREIDAKAHVNELFSAQLLLRVGLLYQDPPPLRRRSHRKRRPGSGGSRE